MALSFSSKTYLHQLVPATRSLSRLLSVRAQSSHSNPGGISDDTDPLLRKLEDAIHGIIVRRSAPDWLPFLPGSSYWVPPPRSAAGIAQLVDKLANPLTQEQSLSTTTVRGWPSSDFFIQDSPSPHPIGIKIISYRSETEPSSNQSEADPVSNNACTSEDEEG